MPTMTVPPSAAMRRFKLAAAAARSALLELVFHRLPATDDGGDAIAHGRKCRASTTTPPAAEEEIHAPPTPSSGPTSSAASASASDGSIAAMTTTSIGARVLVRTPVTAPSVGSGLVREFTLSAVVVSAAGDDGYLKVVYDGRFPPDDPSAAVRVAVEQIVINNTQPPLVVTSSASSSANSFHTSCTP